MKKIIAFILIAVSLLTFSACGGIEERPTPVQPDYPNFEVTDGYEVSGIVTDRNGNPLPNATLVVEGKVRGMTDSTGQYKITGLEGNQFVEVGFNDYEFSKKKIEVKEANNAVNFVGSNNYKTTAYSTVDYNNIYGVTYKIENGNKSRNVRDQYNASTEIPALSGRVTITPEHEFYTFIPKSIDIYSSKDEVEFQAIPKDTTYSASGKVFIEGMNDEEFNMPELEVVDSNMRVLARVQVSMQYDYETQTRKMEAYFNIYGLEKGKEYTLQLRDSEGNLSTQSMKISEDERIANFDLELTRRFEWDVTTVNGIPEDALKSAVIAWVTEDKYVEADYEQHLSDFLDANMSYEAVVTDNGTKYQEEYKGTGNSAKSIVAWPNCFVDMKFTINVGGVLYSATYRDGVVESMMDQFEDNYFEVALTFSSSSAK